MNENINLVEILKDCPKGTKLYSPIFGEVRFSRIDNNQIVVLDKERLDCFFDSTGKFYRKYDNTECLLFPSKDQRDWSKFKCIKTKFDPNTLKPFDKILVRDTNSLNWTCNIFSYYQPLHEFPIKAAFSEFRYCVPYNDDTKHLIGTNNETPEYYKWWED